MKSGAKVLVARNQCPEDEAKRLAAANPDYNAADQRLADPGIIVSVFEDADGKRFGVRVALKNGPARGRVRIVDGSLLSKA